MVRRPPAGAATATMGRTARSPRRRDVLANVASAVRRISRSSFSSSARRMCGGRMQFTDRPLRVIPGSKCGVLGRGAPRAAIHGGPGIQGAPTAVRLTQLCECALDVIDQLPPELGTMDTRQTWVREPRAFAEATGLRLEPP